MVIFGPASSGKSTLAGYLYYILEKDIFDITQFKKNLKIDLGDNYKNDQKFAYIVDRARNERIRQNLKNKGTTKSLHVTKFNCLNNDIYALDTPGIEHGNKERIKGISFADSGIFMIEISTIEKLANASLNLFNSRYLINVLSPLDFWMTYKNRDNLIIAISKMDTQGYSEEAFNRAVNFLGKALELRFLRIIPISVNVDKECDHNVSSRSEELSWFGGPTLLEAISQITENVLSIEESHTLFVSIYREISSHAFGKVLRGRIFQGNLKNDDIIKIAPIIYKNSNLEVINAKVKNIYTVDDNKMIDCAGKGDIVDIDIKDLSINDHRIQKDELSIVASTSIFEPKTTIKNGDLLIFEIDKRSYNSLSNLKIAGVINLIWYGNAISCEIIYKEVYEKLKIILVPTETIKFHIPLETKENSLFDQFILGLDSDLHTFVPAYLKYIGNSEDLIIKIIDINKNEFFDILHHFEKINCRIKTNELGENNMIVLSRLQKNCLRELSHYIRRNDLDSEKYRIEVNI